MKSVSSKNLPLHGFVLVKFCAMTELTLTINSSEDLALVQQLAQRLGIPYTRKSPKTSQSVGPTQSVVFKQMEALRMKMKSLPARPDIDVSALANEVNAI